MINLNEYQVFACFYIIGIIIAFIFDIFKSLRKEIKHKDTIVLIEDFIYLMIVGTIIFLGIFKINYGKLYYKRTRFKKYVAWRYGYFKKQRWYSKRP